MTIQSVVIVTLLYLGASLGSVSLDRNTGVDYDYETECDIVQAFQSPYVTALYERYNVLARGCASREVTPTPYRQVHVINLPLIESGVYDHGPAEITLHIKPRSPTGIFNGALVFVLNSARPVVWKILSERIGNQSRQLFWVSEDSRLLKDARLRIKIKKHEMPSSMHRLAAWVRDQLKAVTSFTQINQANNIFIKVGPDATAPETCQLIDNLHSASVQTAYFQKQETSGCITHTSESSSRSRREVHILEVDAASTAPVGAKHELLVDIKPRSRATIQRHLVLVLKSHHPVVWKLSIKSIRGTLDIKTNDKVNTDSVVLQSVRVAAERLQNYSGQTLIAWARDQYGADISSYTRARLANRFNLIVDGGERERDMNRIRDVNGNGRSKSYLNPGRIQVAIGHSQNVQCTQHGVVVALRKHDLQNHGIMREQLSLLDATCIAKENATHYVLHTLASECGTSEEVDKEKITYRNAIVVRRLPQDDEEGSATEESSGHGPSLDDTRMDDEDFQHLSTIVVNFYCTHHVTQLDENIKYQMHLMRDETFRERYTNYSISTPENHKVYVETRVQADSKLNVVIHNCWLSPSQIRNDAYKFKLIDSGCRFDSSVKYYEEISKSAAPGTNVNQIQRFSFTLPNYWNGQPAYLHCELTVCSTDNNHGQHSIPICLDKTRYCFTSVVKPDGDSSKLPRTGPLHWLHTGPLFFQVPETGEPPGEESGKETTPSSDLQLGDGLTSQRSGDKECRRTVKIEGLDSGTVVGIAFAAFVIGVLLTAALWYIHTHTGPIRANRPLSTETSGESTPSSTAPITIHQVHHH